ncbi:MAG: hypothetical protein ACM30E_13100 [Nitrososphaerales archaeon]
MTQMQDPNEIWRASLTEAGERTEEHPPTILRAEVWPYPDLERLWVRVEISPFVAYPNLELILAGPTGQVINSMFMVEVRETYQSLTLHLRRPPEPTRSYRLTIELTRDEQLLDTRELDFDLVFRDPKGE